MDVKNYQREERFFSSLCPVTLTTDNLIPCPHCGAIFYRDFAAARSHHSTHQPLCRLLSKLSKLSKSQKSVFHENPGACNQLAALAKLALKRNLTQFESDQLIFPRVCGVCHSADATLDLCNGCGCVAYCSEEHQKMDMNHKDECEYLQEARMDYVFWRKVESSTWPGVLAVLDNLSSMDNLPQLTDMQTIIDFILKERGRESEGRALSSILSSPLTCAWAIQDTGIAKEELIIHLVGSRRMEVAYLKAWQIILNIFPQIKTLRLVLVGPECPNLDNTLFHSSSGLVVESVPPCMYDEYAVSEDYKEPSLVAALNCGFILYKSWADSLPHMLRTSGAPLVFTEYYLQDCLDNLREVEAVASLEVIREVDKNKMASLDPARAPTVMWGAAARSLSRGRVVVDNGHVAIVRRPL